MADCNKGDFSSKWNGKQNTDQQMAVWFEKHAVIHNKFEANFGFLAAAVFIIFMHSIIMD